MSLRLRLTMWVLALFVAITSTTAGVAWLYQRSQMSEFFDDLLRTRAASIATQVEKHLPGLTLEQLRDVAQRETRYVQISSVRVMVVDRDGHGVTNSNIQWPDEVFGDAKQVISRGLPRQGRVTPQDLAFDTGRGASVRYVAVPIRDPAGNRYALVVATSDLYVRTQAALATKIFIISGSFGVIAAALCGWYIAGIAVAPLKHAKEFASRLAPESLGEHIDAKGVSAEVKQLTEALDSARQRLRQAFETQERFLSNVSHELKTPIATLLVEAQTIDKRSLSRPAAEFVRTAEEEMRRLGRLVESFLMLTRVQDGKGIVKIQQVPVNELLLDSIANCTPMARQHTVSLRPSLIEDEEHLDAAIAGDPDLLRTMVDNLARNAIRFSPPNGVVRVIARIEDGMFVAAVQDDGPGLPGDLLSKIFNRFVQAPEEQRRGRGHGLGLTIAQAVAELHGGNITVSNLPTAGAEFVARIPLAHRPSDAVSAGMGHSGEDGAITSPPNAHPSPPSAGSGSLDGSPRSAD
ncbi:MAG: sensor histidine kinase [Phycisphaerales bacterium]